MKPVVDAITEGAFVKFGKGIYPQSDFITEVETRRQKIEDDEQQKRAERSHFREDFDKREAADVSVIYTKLPAPAVCVEGPADGALAKFLQRGGSPFADLIISTTVMHYATGAEEIFIDLKKQDCFGVVAATKTLKGVIKGLDRDGILYDVHGKSLAAATLAK
jgi:hypothetical protein